MIKIDRKKQQGFLLLGILFFASLSILTIFAFITWGITTNKLSKHVLAREQSLEIAEAGIEYARWYLAHFQAGYTLGNSGPGPYVYPFKDKDGTIIGSYTLTITPPPIGSTRVKIKSQGKTEANESADRTISIQLAIPSFAKYAVVANNDLRFGQGTVIYGPLHSNGGIRFDGSAWNKITSAVASYNDPDHTGGSEYGVHTHVIENTSTVNDTYRPSETSSTSVPVRSDVFKAGREFPVPAVDFTGITTDLATIKTKAQTNGKYFGGSNAQGYLIVLKVDDTFDLYRVNTLVPVPNSCTTDGTTGWGTWSVNTKSLLGNYAIPVNGLIFVEDNVWVEGKINGARVTIAAAKFPDNIGQRKNITINNNLLYTTKDGSDSIALIAQNNINAGMVSAPSYEIDAALIAQNGRAGRYFYESDCFPYNNRTALTLYGMIATNQRYGFSYTDGSGYATRTIIYDTNLLYAPPPDFPLASDNYQIISWEELES